MKTVALRMHCDAGWAGDANEFIANAVLVDLDLDTGQVRPHFDNDPDVLNARGPMPNQGLLLVEPAGIDDGSFLILRPAWDFSGRATGFHIACQSLSKHRRQLAQWAKQQEYLPLVQLCYRSDGTQSAERLAA